MEENITSEIYTPRSYSDSELNLIFSNLLDEMDKGLADIKHGRVYNLEQMKKRFKIK